MNYREATDAFQSGDLDYDGLRSVCLQLPLPYQKPQAQTTAEIYDLADMPEDDNAVIWVCYLEMLGFINNEQMMDLIAASTGQPPYPPKQPVSP